jgi:VCBS repeat-containing protein
MRFTSIYLNPVTPYIANGMTSGVLMSDNQKNQNQKAEATNTDSGTGSDPDNSHTANSQTQVTLSVPAENQNLTVSVAQGSEIQADFNLANVAIEKAGEHLLLRFEQGGTITLKNINALNESDPSPTIVFKDGSVFSAEQLLSQGVSQENPVEPAAGESEQTSGGVGEYRDDSGAIIEGIERLDGLEFEPAPPANQNVVDSTVEPLQSGTAPSDVSITLDPNITADDNISADEIGSSIAVTGTVGSGVNDGDIVTLTVSGNTYTGSVSDGRFSIDVPGGELANDPDNEIEASVTTVDLAGNTITATDTETYSVLDVPEARDDTITATEDTPVSGDLSSNDTPGDGTNVWDLAGGPSHGSVTVNPDGTFTYTPDPNYNGPDSFTYTITDATGDASTATANITVDAVDDIPAAVDDDITAFEDTPINGDLSRNDTPGDGTNVWALADGPSHGSVTVNPDGTFTYTPDPDYNGPDSFTYSITDADGDFSTATANITVYAANDAPVAVADVFTAIEDTQTSGDLSSNDTPGDGANVWALADGPGHGSVTVNPDGTFTYTPDQNYNGPDSFTYSITDADGDMSTATVNITVGAAGDVPAATEDTVTATEDTPVSGDLASNDIPGDGTNVWDLASGPSNGTVTVNPDGTYTYTPNADYNGPDSFTYTITDADGDVDTATVNITVGAVNDAPDASPDGVYTSVEGDSLTVDPVQGVLTNDTDIDGDALTASRFASDASGSNAQEVNGSNSVTTALGGTVVLNADGSFEYTAPSGLDHSASDVLTDSFYYQASDGQAAGSWTPVEIAVTDTSPTATDIEHTLTIIPNPNPTYNLVIVLDRSISMANDADGYPPIWPDFDPDTVRMDIAKSAVAQLMEKYDEIGNVNVKIVDFSTGVNETGWYINDVQSAEGYVNNISPSGVTHYDAPLNAVMDGYNPPAADKTFVYFISDGEPNPGYGVDPALEAQWEDFAANNVDTSFGVGIGEATTDALLPIAYPNTGGSEDHAVVLPDATQLPDALLDTVAEEGRVSGDLAFDSDSGSDGIVFGADGGHIQSVTIDGETYTYDANSPEMEITTAQGGTLTLNFDTGEYTYSLPTGSILSQDEIFSVVGVDGDGDTADMSLTIHPPLDADPNRLLANDSAASNDGDNDILVSDGGDGILVGGDTLAGGESGNTHTFSSNGGEGNITVSDFNVATDVIRLSDVLNVDGDDDIDLDDLLQPGGQEVTVSVTNADVELSISNGDQATVVTMAGINDGGAFEGDTTLSDLINHGLNVDIS